MKKSKKIILAIFLILVIYVVVNVYIQYKKQFRSFSDFLDDPFRMGRYSDYGGIIPNNSELITKDGQYTIETDDLITTLNLYDKDGTSEELLRYVTDTKRKKNKFYVKAGEGYAVINTEKRTCMICVIVRDLEFVEYNGYDPDKEVTRYESRFRESPLITYCDYDDFYNEDKLVFYTMK